MSLSIHLAGYSHRQTHTHTHTHTYNIRGSSSSITNIDPLSSLSLGLALSAYLSIYMSIYISTHILSLSPLFPSNSCSGSPSLYLFLSKYLSISWSIFHNVVSSLLKSSSKLCHVGYTVLYRCSCLRYRTVRYRTVQSRASNSGEGCSLESRLELLAKIVRATVPNCVLCGPIKHKDYLNVVRGNSSLTSIEIIEGLTSLW